MSKLLRGLVGVVVLGVCVQGYADLITYTTLSAFNPGTTNAYGSGAGDYQARADIYGGPLASQNDLKNAVTGQGGFTGGLGINRIGLGELITPQTATTYGSPNDHGLTVNSITIGMGGSGSPTVTLRIIQGQLLNGGNPVAPNSNNAADVWTPGATLYTNTFTWAAQANAVLARFDLQAANAADNVNNPAPPVLALDTTYLVELDWAWATASDTNDVVWYRSTAVDPGGQMMGMANQAQGFKTFKAGGFGAADIRNANLAINAPAAVPEPSTLVLLGLAVPAVWVARRRK